MATEWSYCKVAYLLDTEEVGLPMCALVRAHEITEPRQLIDAVLSGAVATWPRTTKRGVKQLFGVLRNQCGVDAATLKEAAQRYYL